MEESKFQDIKTKPFKKVSDDGLNFFECYWEIKDWDTKISQVYFTHNMDEKNH